MVEPVEARGFFKTVTVADHDDAEQEATLSSDCMRQLDATPQPSEAGVAPRNDEAPSSARRTVRRSWVIGPVQLANTDTTLDGRAMRRSSYSDCGE
jgi:hypothetical protein